MNIVDKNTLLTSAQKFLLKQSARAIFMLGGFMSLDDIVIKLKVDVFIEPGKPERSVDDYYERAIKHWRKVYEELRDMSRENESLRDEWQKAEVKLWKLNVEREAHSAMRLLGLYDSQKNIVKLFPEAMADADASKMDEYLVSTFVHEVMHAYFNRPGHDKYPYAMFVEEPLAEFGMLLYLRRTNSPYYDWAYENVRSKKCCYRFGAAIMDQYFDGDRSYEKYLEEYKVPVDEFELLSNGRISMPMENGSVNVNGQGLGGKWIPVFSVPPTYFWDNETKTLGLNGDWSSIRNLLSRINISRRYLRDIQHLYLGKDFVATRWFNSDFPFVSSCGFESLFSNVPLSISPHNKEFTIIKGILVRKKDHTPLLRNCGDDLYVLMRAGKYGIIDSNLKNITPFNYDSIRHFDRNDLCEVRIGHHHGLVNKQGEEQVPVIYEDINRKGRQYEVKQNGEVFIIDEFGNKQPKEEK